MQRLRNTFAVDETSDCLAETNSAIIEVFDCYDCIPAKQRSYIRTREDEPVHFTLFNPANANLTFAAFDNCLLGPLHVSRCDFILGNFQKLYFIEIKQVKTNKRRAAKTEAIKQLHSAIHFLKQKINLQATKLVAVICLKAKQVYPLQSAKRSAELLTFKERHNANLMEG